MFHVLLKGFLRCDQVCYPVCNVFREGPSIGTYPLWDLVSVLAELTSSAAVDLLESLPHLRRALLEQRRERERRKEREKKRDRSLPLRHAVGVLGSYDGVKGCESLVFHRHRKELYL